MEYKTGAGGEGEAVPEGLYEGPSVAGVVDGIPVAPLAVVWREWCREGREGVGD